MSVLCKRLPPVLLMSFLLSAAVAEAQDAFIFEWRATATVRRSTEGSDQDTTTRYQSKGSSTLTLVRDPSPDVRFAFDFAGPEGDGNGLVPRAAEATLDPNFTFPSPLPPGLPPPDARFARGALRRLAEGLIPPAFEIVYVETFVCRRSLAACGNVSSWEVLFVGNARVMRRSTP